MHIVVVDDHNLFLQGVLALLKKHLPSATIEMYESVETAFESVTKIQADLILSDIYIPKYKDKNLIELLVEAELYVPVLLISATTDMAVVRKYLDMGAAGFIHKSSDASELMLAIRGVLEKGFYLNDVISKKLKALERGKKSLLSKRQMEVLALLGEGLSNRKIGSHLGVTEATVKTHVSALFDFFDTQNRVACIRRAESLDYLPVSTDQQIHGQ